MKNRPKCSVAGCRNLAKMADKHKDGSWHYKQLCVKHHNKKYEMPSNGSYKKRHFSNEKCIICGWNKAPCDRHRRKPASEEGKYIEGNVISLCPNCHRSLHFGLLNLP